MRNIINSLRRDYLLWLVGVPGLVIHLGTALLRLGMFFPFPEMRDFSGFYAAAWAWRSGYVPYGLTGALLDTLRATRGIPFHAPPIYNPPIWPWLLQPFTWLRYPAAAWLWLLLNLALLAGVTLYLARRAKVLARYEVLLLYLLVVTFGPVFLDLTLGQTSVVLLACAVALGWAVRATARPPEHGAVHLAPARPLAALGGAMAGGLAAGAKLFPLTWLGGLVALRRWRLLLLGLLAGVLFLGGGWLLLPAGQRAAWSTAVYDRITSASQAVGIDDQSLPAWLDRVGRSHSFEVPGMSAHELQTVTWDMPWEVSPRLLKGLGYTLSALLGLGTLVLLYVRGHLHPEAAFYLWVLYTLLVFPHIERYNHTLLLPVLAWLWGRGARGRLFAAGGYTLAGMARLTHLWALLLPAPWGPLATGFGLYAILWLGGGLVAELTGAPQNYDTGFSNLLRVGRRHEDTTHL